MTALSLLFNHDPNLHEIAINGRAFKLANDLATTYERRELVKDTFYALLNLSDRAHRISEASERLVVMEDERRLYATQCGVLDERNDRLAKKCDRLAEGLRQWRTIAIGAQAMLAEGKSASRVLSWIEKGIAKADDGEDEEEEDR